MNSARHPVISARQLTKHYALPRRSLLGFGARPHVVAVDAAEFDVMPGQVFGLLGLNGAGKTTLVRMLCGLLLPSSGTATVLGHDLGQAHGAVRAAVGLASGEERSFSWRLSARRNLLFFAELHGLRGRAAQHRVAEVLGLLGLAAVADRTVGSFSSGMRQKLALARALLHRPNVLFLDEPTRGLDLRASDELLALISNTIVAEQGTTVFLTTHRMEEAEQLCATVAIMHTGQVCALGSPAALYRALDLVCQYVLCVHGPPLAIPDAVYQRVPDLRCVFQDGVNTIGFGERNGALHTLLAFLATTTGTITSLATRPPSLEQVVRHYTDRNGLYARSHETE